MSRSVRRWMALVFAGVLSVSVASAQEEGGRGGFGRGGFGGGGFPGGGFPGGGPPGMGGGGFPGGGFPGGGFGGGGSFPGGGPPGMGGGMGDRMSGFVRMMDRDGNGQIDPEELSDRSRSMIERMGGGQFDTSKPISVDKLMAAVSSRMGGGPTSGSTGSTSSSGSGLINAGTSATPTVPGFGIDIALPAVPGFGDSDEMAGITAADLEEARNRLREADRNQDGFLDRDEARFAQFSDDPFKYDRDGDGRLNLQELAARYAARRAEQRNAKIEQADKDEAARSLQRYDTNRNGVLEADEIRNGRWSDNPLDYDRNGDGKLTVDELAGRYAARRVREQQDSSRWSGDSGGRDSRFGGGPPMMMMFGGGGFDRGDRDSDRGDRGDRGDRDSDRGDRGSDRWGGGGFGGDRGGFGGGGGFGGSEGGGGSTSGTTAAGDAAAAEANARKSYRALTGKERVPTGVPSWFTERDGDGDGQIAMFEFESRWTPSAAAEFAKHDRDGDGLITAREALGGSGSAPSGPAPAMMAGGGDRGGRDRSGRDSRGSSSSAPATPSAPAAPVASVDERYRSYAAGRMKTYDKNSDGFLDAAESKELSGDPLASGGDKDADGKVSADELTGWYAAKAKR